MKKLFIFVFLMSLATMAQAYDFEVKGIYYNIIDADAHTVEVTNSTGDVTANCYTGQVYIASVVQYRQEKYIIESIGKNAFSGCNGLVSVQLPDNLKSIGDSAFVRCPIPRIMLPESLTTIGRDAFRDCSQLTEVFALSNQPIEIMDSVFDTTIYPTAQLFVPIDSQTKYQQAKTWSNFGSITEVLYYNRPSTWVTEALLLPHDRMMFWQRDKSDSYALATGFDAAPISPAIDYYMQHIPGKEQQIIYLEGDKTYYLDGTDAIYQSIMLATLPTDVAEGKRARVICGIGKNDSFIATNGEQWQGSYAMFMLGRQPNEGEDRELSIQKVIFSHIDFDNPMSLNYGDNTAGLGTVCGNYFINMYSNALALTLDSLVISDCTFKRLVRGFLREQGSEYRVLNHVSIQGNQFFDCGYYNRTAGGYPWIASSCNDPKSNLFRDFCCVGNTFYDSPMPSFLVEENNQDRLSGAWNITFSNNTLVNFNTRGNGAIFKMRNLPNGSVYNVQNNLFVLCKQEADLRNLNFWGADIRNTETLADGTSGKVTLNFDNNWSTNNDLTNGQIFSDYAWSSTRRNFGELVQNGDAVLNGTLEIKVADISATDLFTNPCPPHIATSDTDQHMHRADALDGSSTTPYNVNLYYKNTTNLIVENNVGDPRWRGSADEESIEMLQNYPSSFGPIYDIFGHRATFQTTGRIYIAGNHKRLIKK